MVQEGISGLTYLWLLIAIFYLSLSFVLSRYLRTLHVRLLRLVQLGLGLGVVVHWGALLSFVARENLSEPSLVIASSMVSALSVLACLILVLRRRAMSVVLFALPFTGAGMILSAFFYDQQDVIRLPSIWLWSHVLLMVIGELCYFFASMLGVLYLVAEMRIKKRGDFRLFSGGLSSLPEIEEWMILMLRFGLFFLSMGLLMGFFFAREFWSGAWWLDPKVVLALLSWLAYLLLTIVRCKPFEMKGRAYAWGVIASFIFAVLMSLLADQFGGAYHQPQPGTSIERSE